MEFLYSLNRLNVATRVDAVPPSSSQAPHCLNLNAGHQGNAPRRTASASKWRGGLSYGEYGSRALGFILDRNRINVAISRAQCLDVVVATCELLVRLRRH
jgi:hypothetical protein